MGSLYDTGSTWARDQHGHGINTGTGTQAREQHGHGNMGTGSTQAWEHRHGINMGTRSTWARDQHRDGNMGMELKHFAIIRQPGVRGQSPWQAGDPVLQEWSERSSSPCRRYGS